MEVRHSANRKYIFIRFIDFNNTFFTNFFLEFIEWISQMLSGPTLVKVNGKGRAIKQERKESEAGKIFCLQDVNFSKVY